jgi:hypothetical protein
MLCIIKLKEGPLSSGWVECIIDVPDALFMYHMAAYGAFKPTNISDRELRDCKWVGQRNTMTYFGPAEEKDIK